MAGAMDWHGVIDSVDATPSGLRQPPVVRLVSTTVQRRARPSPRDLLDV